MSQSGVGYIDQTARSNWIRLRTLVLVRWFAIAGQSLALLFGWLVFDLQLPILFCTLIIGFSVLLNVFSTVFFPDNRRLTEIEAAGVLQFDILQLCILLSLTGGIDNPFALLVLAPVTIAASVLPSRLAFLLGAVAIILITLISFIHIPLQTVDGRILSMPTIFEFGLWSAIVIGISFIALYTRRVTAELTSMSEALLATQMALAREQKLTDLGGVVAATAHELGTPLATIKLVSSELIEDSLDNNDLKSDLTLIREQAERCGKILQSMGRAGKDDVHMRSAPWLAVVEEAAEPHISRGIDVSFETDPENPGSIPNVKRKPEVIHGIRNIVQNAVDFANTNVVINVGWTEKKLFLKIMDDGNGYSPQVIHRLGDPFVRQRSPENNPDQRPAYEGMGLGLFIAKTLLERSGAVITFGNNKSIRKKGAVVDMVWKRSDLEVSGATSATNPLVIEA